MNGQHSQQRHQASLGQAGQTLRNIRSSQQLESDDEEQQQGTKAKAAQAPKQPTPQEILEFLTALTTAVANKNGNITTRNSGAYSSQSQGGVERAHRTLFAQIRTLKAQIRQNYNRDISMKHPLMPWIVRHSAYIMNRYAVHSNGCTSYFNRWNREQHTPLCEFGETVQHMLPTVKQFPRINNKIVRARTISRQIMPHKYNQQLLDSVQTGPWKTPASALHTPTLATPLTMPATSKTPPSQKDATTSTAAECKRQSATEAGDQPTKQKRTTEPTSSMARSPIHQKRPALPAPPPTSPTRERDDTIAEGSTGKQQRITTERQALERPTSEQPKSKMRMSAIEFTTKDGKQMQTTSNEDAEKSTMKGSY